MSYDPREHGAQCDKCYLLNRREGEPVPPEMNEGATATIVAEAPGREECQYGRPLIGQSGQELQRSISAMGYSRADFNYTNALLCRPPGNELGRLLNHLKNENKERKKKYGKEGMLPSPMACCRPRLLKELADVEHIITLGSTPVQSITGTDHKVMAIRGGPIEGWMNDTTFVVDDLERTEDMHSVKILPTIHPAFVLRQRKWTKTFRTDIGRAMRWFTNQLGWVDPEVILHPTVEQIEKFLLHSNPRWFSWDVETTREASPLVASLFCLGVAYRDRHGRRHAMVIPFHSKEHGTIDGAWGHPNFYSTGEFKQIVDLVRVWLTSKWYKIGHNSDIYDRTVVEATFGVTPTPRHDTLVLHRATESELPHSLGFVGTTITDVTAWKADKTGLEAKTDLELHQYNAIDCVVTDDIVEPLVEAAKLRDQWGVVKKDYKFLNLCNGMHRIGMKIDPKVRDRYDAYFLGEALKYKKICREVVSIASFNPSSVDQVKSILFDRWNLPPIEISETTGEPSTDDDTLRTYRISYNLTRQQLQFIEALRRCRNAVKMRGTDIVKYRRWNEALPPDELWEDLEESEEDKQYRKKKDLKKRGILLADGRVHAAWNQLTTCVTPDTWVITEAGLQQIGTLPGWGAAGTDLPAHNFALHDGDKLQGVSRQINPGTTPVLRAQTLLGFDLTGPHHHRILIAREKRFWGGHLKTQPVEPEAVWCRLDELKAGDYVKVPVGMEVWAATPPILPHTALKPSRTGARKNEITLPSTVSTDLAFFAGAYNADGSLHDANGSFSIRISCRVRRERLPVLVACAERLFGAAAVNVDADGLNITSISLALWCEALGFGRRLESKRAPWWLLASPRNIVEAYLRGLSLDASVNLSGPGTTPQWRLSNSKQLCQEVQMVLCNMGIVSSLRDVSTPKSPRAWELRAHARDAHAVCAITGQILPTPTREIAFPKPKFTRRNNTLWLRVEGVEDGGVQPVLDVTVPTTQRFWSNGFVSHNSGRANCTQPNLQNKRRKYRDMYIPEEMCPYCKEPHVFVAGDMDQLELRFGANRWNLTRYLEVFAEGRDPHAETASAVFGAAARVSLAQAVEWAKEHVGSKAKDHPNWKRMRDFAKRFFYACQYRAEDETVYDVITSVEDDDGNLIYADVSMDTTRERRSNLLAANPEFNSGWEWEISTWRKNGFLLEPVWGRRRDFLNGEEPNEIVNFPIQAGGRAVVMNAAFAAVEAIPFERWCPKTGLVHDGHDSLMFEVPLSKGKWAVGVLNECMLQHVKGHSVPYTAEARVGVNSDPRKGPVGRRSWADV